jgi:hypothetical protein
VEVDDGTTVVVQGFRGDDERGINPYVFLGVAGEGDWVDIEINLTPENAHILSEEIRKHAEFAATPRTEEEK